MESFRQMFFLYVTFLDLKYLLLLFLFFHTPSTGDILIPVQDGPV